MAYNYGPPPPPPPPAPPSSGSAGYPSSYGPQRGSHGGRGRGGADRSGYHQTHPGYGYSHGQQAPYGPSASAPYQGPPTQPGYPQPQQQTWHPDHGQPQHHQHHQQHPPQGAPPAPLPPQNYHPGYPPPAYPQQPSYGGQPQYQPAPQPAYGQPYPPATPQPGPPTQQWSSPPSHGAYGGGGGRGGRGGYNDRGGPKGQLMGPPIRIGFDSTPPQPSPAPVSAPYPYGGPPPPPAPYAAPYAGYPPPGPYMPAAQPAPFGGYSGPSSRPHGRGGFHHAKSRTPFGGDKNRNRTHHKAPATPTPPTRHQKPDAASAGKKKKRKTNTLGLTPGDESDEDDENEEERLNEMYGADAPNPKTASEIAAWIAERRARYPTKSRVEAKKAAAQAQNGDTHHVGTSTLEQKAEKLRKQLEKVESSIKRKREQQDEGDEMRDIDLSSSSSSDADSDDEKPEVMTSRQEQSNVPPPPKKADPTKHCKYYSTGGTCGKRSKCRFVHDPAVREAALRERELNGGRMTLQQRLTLNDKEQEDLTIVETLKYLQDKGVLPKKVSATPAPDEKSEADSAPQTAPHAPPVKEDPDHDLPPVSSPPASLDDQTAKYPGWNLSGFGNTGVRPSE